MVVIFDRYDQIDDKEYIQEIASQARNDNKINDILLWQICVIENQEARWLWGMEKDLEGYWRKELISLTRTTNKGGYDYELLITF